MEILFKTPTEVWEKYENTQEALETSIISQDIDENIVCSKEYYTAENTENGPLRAYCELYYDKRWADKRPAALLIPPIYKYDFREVALKLVNDGYFVCIVDYCGNLIGTNQTVYPELLSFAKWPTCINNLITLNGNANNTVYYIWATIARRAISLLCEQNLVDSNKIAIIGNGVGAQISWIVAGIDKRVSALAAINGGGYLWAPYGPSSSNGYVPQSDEQSAFSSGIGAETYARLITCPVLFIASSNSTYYDIDKSNYIMANVKSDSKLFLVSQGSDSQITKSSFDFLIHWLREDFLFSKQTANHPTLSFENLEGKLYLKLNTIHGARERNVYVCIGEPYAYARSWKLVTNLQKVNTHEYTCLIPVDNSNKQVVAYATIKYNDNRLESTPIVSVTPSKISIPDGIQLEDQKDRIIYNGSMGLGTFTAVTNSSIIDEDSLQTKTGPFNIVGISAVSGSLYLRHNAKDLESVTKSGLLHFDVYSPTKRELELEMYSYPDRKQYYTTVYLDGGEFWQNIILDCSDFKSKEGKPLLDFNASKLFRMKDVANLIFNNFLWI